MRRSNIPVLLRGHSAFTKSGDLVGLRSVDRPMPSTLWSPVLELSRQQPASNHEQVRQRASHLHAVKVLRQTSIPNLREAKQSFDYPEGVLHSGADLRLGSVLAPLGLVDLTVVAVALIDEVLRLWRLFANHIPLAAVRLISVHPSLFSVQQMRQRQGISHIRCGDFYGVDDLLFTIHSDVGLHPEIPLFSLGRLMHLRITLPALVLCRRGRTDDRRIHDRATAHLDALLM